MRKVYLVVVHDTTQDYFPQENPVFAVFDNREEAEKCRDELNKEYALGITAETLRDDYPEQEDDAFGTYCYYRVWEMPIGQESQTKE